jgi:transcription-repair coupling factor (superfamily II helicase)
MHKALALKTLAARGKKVVLLCSEEGECARMAEDLSVLGESVLTFPFRDFTLNDVSSYSREYEHKRIGTLSRLLGGDFSVLLLSVDAAMQRTLPAEKLREHTFSLSVGEEFDLAELSKRLVEAGYSRSDIVEGAGQFSQRGSIVDIFPPDRPSPIRLDFWGDELDKLSEIDVILLKLTPVAFNLILDIFYLNFKFFLKRIIKKLSLYNEEVLLVFILLFINIFFNFCIFCISK